MLLSEVYRTYFDFGYSYIFNFVSILQGFITTLPLLGEGFFFPRSSRALKFLVKVASFSRYFPFQTCVVHSFDALSLFVVPEKWVLGWRGWSVHICGGDAERPKLPTTPWSRLLEPLLAVSDRQTVFWWQPHRPELFVVSIFMSLAYYLSSLLHFICTVFRANTDIADRLTHVVVSGLP